MTEGYIKLHRSMLDWEWYKDPNTLTVFLYCLLMANWKAGRFKGKEVPEGSFVTSLPHLAKGTGLTVQQVRTALKHLKSTGELTEWTTSKFRIITVKNWSKFQSLTDKVTDNQQTSNRQVTTIEEKKERKNRKNISTFPQRSVDWDALERELVEAQDKEHADEVQA